jgi:hypothetical protein
MSKDSRKFKVPDELANLYDFANSLDVRHFVHHGTQHQQSDELAGPRELGTWMAQRGLMKDNAGKIAPAMFEAALRLRSDIRAYLACDPAERRNNAAVADHLKGAGFISACRGDARRQAGAAAFAQRRGRRGVPCRCRALRRLHNRNSRPVEDVCRRGMPPGIFRSIEAGDTSLVHVVAVREPDQDAQLSRTPSRQ